MKFVCGSPDGLVYHRILVAFTYLSQRCLVLSVFQSEGAERPSAPPLCLSPILFVDNLYLMSSKIPHLNRKPTHNASKSIKSINTK